jgi:hypothetical protein
MVAEATARVVRNGEARWELLEGYDGDGPVGARLLRQHGLGDPESGDTLLMRFPPGFHASLSERTSPWQELVVLAGRLQAAEEWFSVNDHVSFPPGYVLSTIATGNEGAEALVVRGPPGSEPPAMPPVQSGGPERRAVPHGEWGYLDLRDRTDRLPLRWERTRGEATWLLRYPPGHSGTPTCAEGVALEAFVLSGDVSVPGSTPPFGPHDYLFFPAGAIPEAWGTRHGCKLWLRTIAAS